MARSDSGGSAPTNIPTLTRTLDQLLSENQQLLRKNHQLMGKLTSLRNNPMTSRIPVKQIQTFESLTEKNHLLRKNNQQLQDELAAFRDRTAGPSAGMKVNSENIIAKIADWVLSGAQKG